MRIYDVDEYTKGPWVVDPLEMGQRWNIKTLDGAVDICLCSPIPSDIEYKQRDANARLIAAAPELLEAAKSALRTLEKYRTSDAESDCDAVDLEDAIIKAVGGF